MSGFVHWSARFYRGMVVLYPLDLRQEFGTEMAEVFAEDLADAWRSGNAGDVIGVWSRALLEIVQIALPGRLANQALVAPAVSLALHLAAAGGIVALTAFAEQGIPHGILHGLVTLRVR